jgi:hypothetical protein
MIIWPFRRRKNHIKIGGQSVEVTPLSLQNATALILLMAPYWPILDEHLPNLEHAMINKDRPLLVGIFTVLREEMRKAPGDITRAVALLAGLDAEWVARNATAAEMVEALPVLDQVHDLRRLWGTLRAGSFYLGGEGK